MTSFLTNEGYLALVIFAFIQACCIPISSEITFGFAGVLAYQGHLSLALVIVIGTLAEFAGSSTAYGIGRLGGRSAIEKYRRYLLLTRKDVERVERFFDGRGTWSVALARVIPLVRAFAGLVAGLVEVPLAPFAIFNLIGTVVWATALSLLGYAVGNDWSKVSKSWSYASDALAAGVILMLVVLIVHKWQQVRKERKADAIAAAGPGRISQGTPASEASAAAPAASEANAAGPAASQPAGTRQGGAGRHRAPTDSQGG